MDKHQRPFPLPSVILATYINSHFPEMLRVADLFLKHKQYQPLVVFVHGYGELGVKEEFIRHCFDKKIGLISERGTKISPNKYWKGIQSPKTTYDIPLDPNSLKAKLIKLIKSLPIIDRVAFYIYLSWRSLSYYPFLKIRKRTIEKLLDRISPTAIVLPEDNVGYHTGIFTNWSNIHRVPSVIVPYTIANETEAAEHLKDLPAYQLKGFFNRLAGLFFPKWVYTHLGKRLLLLPGLQIFIIELFKFSAPRPWMINSGFASAIAVESQAMMEYFLRNDLPLEKLHLTGSTSDDILFEAREKSCRRLKILYRELKIDNTKPMLLCAVPPPWFPRDKCEFIDYRSLIDYWMRILGEVKNFNVVASLHPRINFKELEYIENYGVKISRQPTNQLVALCSIYVANVSATIRWAVACGVPVLNYDVYQYHFHDYDNAPGVITVYNRADFRRYIKLFTKNGKFLANIRAKQIKDAPKWGKLDGRSNRRIIKLFDKLTQAQSR